jgi:hypothetical protein
MPYNYLVQIPRNNPVLNICIQVLGEILCIVSLILVIWTMIRKYPVKNYRQLFVPEPFQFEKYHTGDLLISFGDYLDQIHPGHLAIVIETCPYGQKFVWDLDSSEELHVLKPLAPFVKKAVQANGKIFVRHSIGTRYDAKKLRKLMGLFSKSKYDYQAVVEHGNFILHQYLGFPGVPIFPQKQNRIHYYCSEMILHLLIQYGILSDTILESIPDLHHHTPEGHVRLFYPNILLDDPMILNQNCNHGFYYEQPHVITFDA